MKILLLLLFVISIYAVSETVRLDRVYTVLPPTIYTSVTKAPPYLVFSGIDGILFRVNQTTWTATVWADISSRVYRVASLTGLFGVTHTSTHWYLSYVTNTSFIVERFPLVGDNLNISAGVILLNLPWIGIDHFAGWMEVQTVSGKTYLYVATGVEQSPATTDIIHGVAQNTSDLRGKMLRLQISPCAGVYCIPSDNPFGNEVYAYGMRNPFDCDLSANGLICAFPGENNRECLINVTRGSNHGWPIVECDTLVVNTTTTYFPADYVTPIVTYSHEGGCSAIGGYYYNGTRFPSLKGKYLFADFGCFGSPDPTANLYYYPTGAPFAYRTSLLPPGTKWFDYLPVENNEALILRFAVTIFEGLDNEAYLLELDTETFGTAVLSFKEPVRPAPVSYTEIVTTGSIPSYRAASNLIAAGDDILYMFGGYYESANGTVTYYNTMYSLDLNTDIWSLAHSGSGTAPSPRAYSGMAFQNNRRIYLYGGNDATNIYGDMWRFNTVTASWTMLTPAHTPGPITKIEMVYFRKNLYFFGGQYLSGFAYVASANLNIYNVDSEDWTIVSPGSNTPQARYSNKFVLSNDRTIVLYGGESNRGFFDYRLSDLWNYDTTSSTWSQLLSYTESNKIPVTKGAAWINEDNFYLAFGNKRQGGCPKGGSYFYSSDETWNTNVDCSEGFMQFRQVNIKNGPGSLIDVAYTSINGIPYITHGFDYQCYSTTGYIWSNKIYTLA